MNKENAAQVAVSGEPGELCVFQDSLSVMARVQFSDAKLFDVNPNLCSLLGLAKADLAVTSLLDISHPDDIELHLHFLKLMSISDIHSYTVIKRLLHRQNYYITCRLTMSVEYNAVDLPYCALLVIEDIGEGSLTKDLRRDSWPHVKTINAIMKSPVDAWGCGLLILGEQGQTLFENAEWKRIWFTDADKSNSSCRDYICIDPVTGNCIPKDQLPWSVSLKEGVRKNNSLEIERFNGDTGWVSVSSAPVYDHAGRIVGTVTSIMDVSDLRGAHRSLLAADKRLDESLAMLSHELRTPLASIVLAVELLDRRINDPDSRHILDILKREGVCLRDLVERLLDVSALSQGVINLKFESLDLGKIICDAVERAKSLIDEKKHRLILRLPDEPVVVSGDAVRLEQVFVNLLANAAKYTNEGGKILVHLTRVSDSAHVTVCDNGIGMTEEVSRCAFDMFSQAQRGHQRCQGGLGIGLAIVKTLVQQHHGKIEVISGGPNEGSTFAVTLPVA